MPKELVEMLARAEVPATARAEVEAGGAPVWVFERDTGTQQITMAGVVRLAGTPKQIADDFFRRNSLLEADILKASGSFSDPAVLADVAKYSNPKQTYALYGDRLLFDGEVGSVKRKLLRSSVVDDLRQRLGKLGAKGG